MPPWIEIILRTISAIFFLFIVTKILGKRQLSELSLFEYITGITIGNLAASLSIDLDGRWYQGVASLTVWALVAMGIEYITLKSKRLRNVLDGKSTILIKNGQILEENLGKERITVDELMEQLRYKNIFSLSDVDTAILEQNGTLNVLLKKENQPLTPKMLGIKVEKETFPEVVISDGCMMEDTLISLGLTRNWLMSELKKRRLQVEDVFLAQVTSNGSLYIDLYEDKIHPVHIQAGEKNLLYTLLNKCEADLALMHLSAKDPKAKKIYKQSAEQLRKEIMNLRPLLK
ncbi:DUF421 domain-containing protein [Thermoactinomyces sp. DSM 45892]|uniref:DUF421 domain-containing protein n=1 Tax=Thermoactinomyces sp. DSM 45892 TaxID=1882753 RepID=UPI00089D1542|nr:DUF421 domain-containing protein [Thermoactinomyces sp. DSM 45892]SDY11454.1 Uncharacterized membrane protein YcaP, DUF421 family [Thermoactinomyces sp. DSM 45892]